MPGLLVGPVVGLVGLAVVPPVVVVFLPGVLVVLGGLVQVPAVFLGGLQVFLQVHGAQLLLGYGGQSPQGELPGDIRPDEQLQLPLVGVQAHPQSGQAAGQGRPA